MRFANYKRFPDPIEVPFWSGDQWTNGHYWIEPIYGALLGPPKGWERDIYGFFPYGRWDSSGRTGLAMLAYPELREVFREYVLETQWNRLRYLGPVEKKRKGKKYWGHPYYCFSRDMRIMGMASLFLSGDHHEINRMASSGRAFDQPLNPSFSMRPSLKHWLRYLDSGSNKDAERFHRSLALTLQLFGKPVEYALHLISWQLYCCPNPAISEMIVTEYVPEWNYLLRMLNGEYVPKGILEKVESWEGYQWQHYEPRSEEKKPWPDVKLDSDEPFHLDIDILMYVYNREFSDIEHWINEEGL